MNNRDAGMDRVSRSKRAKKLWQKSGTTLSLKMWARTSDDVDVREWLNQKSAKQIKSQKEKIVKKSKSEKEEKNK